MKALTSRLRSSKRKKDELSTQPVPVPTTQFNHGSKWQQDIAGCQDIYLYLSIGQPIDLSSASQRIRTITDCYLRYQSYGNTYSKECDQLLDNLVEEYTLKNPVAREVAVVACLHVFSIPAAQRHIADLQADVGKYLRLLQVVAVIRSDIIPAEEALVVQCLHQLPPDDDSISKQFKQLLEAVKGIEHWNFLTLDMLQELLINFGWETRLHVYIQDLLYKHRYMSAFKAVSWLKSLDTENPSVRALLDKFLPSWKCMRLWEPIITRVSKFELSDFTEEQKRRLGDLLTLDGPDNSTMKEPYLAKVDGAHRFGSTRGQPLLHLLYRCCCLGTHAIDLFIILCMSSSTSDGGSSCLEEILDLNDDSCCLAIRQLLETADSEGNLSHQLRRYTTAFSTFPKNQSRISWDSPPLNHIRDQAISELVRAQQTFLDALERTSGTKMGMLIQAFGAIIVDRDDIFRNIPEHFLHRIRRHPPQDTLKTIFDRIWATSQSAPIDSCRLKMYLAERLGGQQRRNLDDSITPAAINDEIKFWKNAKGTARMDLARIVEKFRAMDYSNYTTWLLATLDEDDQFIVKTKDFLMAGEEGVLRFGEYLATRREFKSMRHETWLLLFTALIQEQKPEYLREIASSMHVQEWHQLTSTISKLIESVRRYIPQTGTGLTLEKLDWWMALSGRTSAVQILLGGRVQNTVPIWLYFPQRIREIESLLDRLEQRGFSSSVEATIVPYLSSNGSNLQGVLACITALQSASSSCKEVFRRQIERNGQGGKTTLSASALRAILELWISDRDTFNPSDLKALRGLGDLLRLPNFTAKALPELRKHLEISYNALIERLKVSERRRLRMHISDPNRTRVISDLLEIESMAHSRASQEAVPEEIADAVEVVGDDTYELSFPLIALNDLHRAAKGIPPTDRLFIVRLVLSRSVRGADNIWCAFDGRSSDGQTRPKEAGSTFFGYYAQSRLRRSMSTAPIDLLKIYNAVASLISNRPEECLVCSGRMGTRLWKPATCTAHCSRSLRQAPLEARLHNLMVSPKAIDLLLATVYAASTEPQAAQFLPYCPVPHASLKEVIDSMPSLNSIQTASDVRHAIRGSDRHGSNREALLSWLCLRFRGLILANPDGFKIPSLGVGTEQFLVASSNHEREAAFGQHYSSTTGSTVVFHGTRASRLFPILTDGLRVANNQNGMMLHGAAYGQGIYCGHDMQTSWGFTGSIGQTWQNSVLGGLKVMLGCELAPLTAGTHGSVHVISDETRLLVRYVFLLPQNFQPPIRAHVEPAMVAGIAKLRSG